MNCIDVWSTGAEVPGSNRASLTVVTLRTGRVTVDSEKNLGAKKLSSVTLCSGDGNGGEQRTGSGRSTGGPRRPDGGLCRPTEGG